MKKLLIILALLLVIPLFALAEDIPDTYTCGDFEYVLLEDGTAQLVDYNGHERELTIPAEIDGYTVTSLAAHIDNAIPSWEILMSVTIPDSVTHIPANPFINSRWLSSIHVSPEHPTLEVVDGVLIDKVEKRLICYPATLSAESYTVPAGICAIGDYAFPGIESLTSIDIPQGVTYIGDYAFSGCSALQSVAIPEGVTAIGNNTFRSCTALHEVIIPEGVTIIGDFAFWKCSNLEVLQLPDSLTTIGTYAFADNSFTAITIPTGVTSIGDWAFSGCLILNGVTVTVDSYAHQWFIANKWPGNLLLVDD